MNGFDAVLGWDLALAALLLALAGIVRGFTGFGSAMMVIPLYSLMYGPVQAIGLSVVVEAVITVQLMPRAAREAGWRDVLYLSLTACPMIPLANMVLMAADPDLMRRLIAALVIVFAGVMLIGWRYYGRRHPVATLIAGALAGALIGTVGMAGPVVVLYLLSGPDLAARNRATIIVFFAVIEVVLFTSLWLQGGIVTATLWRALILSPVFIATVLAGERFFDRSSEAFYRRIVLHVLIGIGALTLVI